MWQKQEPSCFTESIKALEAHLQHANNLAAALPRDYYGDCVQMRLCYSPFAPLLLQLLEWMEFSCTDPLPNFLGLLHILVYKVYVDGMPSMSSKEKTASLREFYAVIYPSLIQLEGDLMELEEKENKRNRCSDMSSDKSMSDDEMVGNEFDGRDREDCGICMESCSGDNMVLPNCGHSLCMKCYNDWNSRSRSCPFCRGSLKKVNSKDLWVLISNLDVVDTLTLAKENISRFYHYIESLPSVICTTDTTHIFIYDYLI